MENDIYIYITVLESFRTNNAKKNQVTRKPQLSICKKGCGFGPKSQPLEVKGCGQKLQPFLCPRVAGQKCSP